MTALPTTTGDNDNMRRGLAVSASLHFLGLLFLFFGLPALMKPLPTPSTPVPFEIVDISDITNTRTKDQPVEQAKPPPPAPEPKAVTPPPQPQTPPAPPEPPKPPQPQEMKREQVEALTVPKPTEKPPPPKAAEKPKPDMLASVLKNVEKLKTAPQVKNPEATSTAKTQSTAQPKSVAPSLSDRLTISENDALRRQIENCWNFDPGIRNAQTLVVEVIITVNPDRTVQSAEVVDKSRMASDPYFRAAAEAAIRAVYNPKCSPLELPDGKYEQWKNISFTFDPRDML